jgi:hypothetical protein
MRHVQSMILVLVLAGLLGFGVAQSQPDAPPPPPPPSPGDDAAPEPADEIEPWLSNVAGAAGLGPWESVRCKWADLNGDEWPDVLIIGWGREWQRDFFAANNLPDGLPTPPSNPAVGPQITRANWPGDAEAFDLYDFDDNGTLTAQEMGWARSMHQLRAFFSVADESVPGGRRFEEVTEQTGLWANRAGTARGREMLVMTTADVDNDGDTDFFSGAYLDLLNPEPSKPDFGDRSVMLLNDGTGKFTYFEQPTGDDEPIGPPQQPSTVAGASFVDVNRDGILDLFTGSFYEIPWVTETGEHDRLYLGLGDGRFRDVTATAGMIRDKDIYAGLTEEQRTWGERERRDKLPRALYMRMGAHATKPAYGVAHADWDGDGDQDLFVMSYGRQWNLHWENLGVGADGVPRFREIGRKTWFAGDAIDHGEYPYWVYRRWPAAFQRPREDDPPFRANGNSYSAAFGDWNADGHLDAILGEITHAWAGTSSDLSAILTNLGPDRGFEFERRPDWITRPHDEDDTSWNQGDMNVAWADIDNDGFLDALVSSSDYPDEQRLRLFRQIPPAEREADAPPFRDVTLEVGLDWLHSHQISLADYDRDGDLDILATRNPVHPATRERV